MKNVLQSSLVEIKGTSCATQTATASDNRPGLIARMGATWTAALNALVPLGYEDESGFHYGEADRRRRAEHCRF